MIKTALSNQEVACKLIAVAQASIDADEFGTTEWDEGRLDVFHFAKRFGKGDLKSWAINELAKSESYSEVFNQEPSDYSQGREAGYRNIIDELCAQEVEA
ncbi:hypothetical protein [Lacticaseibacillus sp. N501-2]|uniref:hypothetical protein n=1 Tax=Lacticaseibacillus salsurae TaxID=3367729 RepID=UPI0038B38B45